MVNISQISKSEIEEFSSQENGHLIFKVRFFPPNLFVCRSMFFQLCTQLYSSLWVFRWQWLQVCVCVMKNRRYIVVENKIWVKHITVHRTSMEYDRCTYYFVPRQLIKMDTCVLRAIAQLISSYKLRFVYADVL